jgi:hypothetical protein
MRARYLACHEAGLCCYLVTYTENLLHPLQLLYLHLWPIYWLTLVKPFTACCLLTVEILQLHMLRSYLHSLPCRTQLSTDNSQASSYFLLSFSTVHWQLTGSVRESELLCDWRFIVNQFALASSPLGITTSNFFQLNTYDYSLYIISSLSIGWICRLQLLLDHASTVILRSESPWDSWPYFTVSHSRLLQLEGQVPVFISPRNKVVPRHWVPFSSPPTTRRATVEAFDPASTRDTHWVAPILFIITPSRGSHRKLPRFHCCGRVFTVPLHSNSFCLIVSRSLSSNGSVPHNMYHYVFKVQCLLYLTPALGIRNYSFPPRMCFLWFLK